MAASLLNTVTGQAASFTTTITTTQDYPAGSSIIVVVAFRPAGDADNNHYYVSDTVNGQYDKDVLSYAANNGGIAIMSKHNITALPSGSVITVRMGDSGNKVAAIVSNWSGIQGTTPLDKTSVNPATGVNSPSAATYTSNATATTTQASELLIGGLLLHFDTPGTLTKSTGFSNLGGNGVATSGGSAGSNAWAWAQYQEVSATGAYTSNPSSATSRNYRSAIATYKLAATGTTYTNTATAKARVKSLGTTNSVSAKARRYSATITNTATARARVKGIGTTRTVTAKAKVTNAGAANIQYVQGNSAGSAGAYVIAHTVTLPSPTTLGNSLILELSVSDNTVPSVVTGVTDNQGNTWTKVLSIPGVSNVTMEIWYCGNVTTAGSTTVTIATSAYVLQAANLEEWSGLADSNVLDQYASNAEISYVNTHSSPATATTTQAAELVVGAYSYNGFGATMTPGSGFSRPVTVESPDYVGLFAQSKIVSATGAYQSTLDSGSSYLEGVNLVATFKAKIGTTSTTTSTVTAKARIATAGTTRTVSAKARVKKTDNANSVQSKARNKIAGTTRTATARARVKGIGTTYTVTAKARAKILGTTRTATAKARAKLLAFTYTATARARVKIAQTTRTITAKARVKGIGNTNTIQARASADLPVGTRTSTVTAKARVLGLGALRTVSAKARNLIAATTRTITAKGRTKKTFTYTATSKARVASAGTTRTITAKARVKISQTTRTVTAKAKVKFERLNTVTAKARAKVIDLARTVTAKARIKSSGTTRTISARAKMVVSTGDTWYPYGAQPTGLTQAQIRTIFLTHYENDKAYFLTQSGMPAGMPAGAYRIKVPDQNDPVTGLPNGTFSEGIGYWMVIFAYTMIPTSPLYDSNAKTYFDGLWTYYQYFMNAHGLMNWRIDHNGNVTGTGGATDGDEDAALALVIASRTYGGRTGTYGVAATTLINNIRDYEFLAADHGTYPNVMMNGDQWGASTNRYMPDYFRPAHYREFYRHTGDSRWLDIIAANYPKAQGYFQTNYPTGFVPDESDRSSLAISGLSYKYGYNAIRMPWSIATDYLWNGPATDALAYSGMNKLATWIKGQASNVPGNAKAEYTLDGTGYANYVNQAYISGYGAAGLVSSSHSAWAGACASWINSNAINESSYFGRSLGALSLLLMTGEMKALQSTVLNTVSAKARILGPVSTSTRTVTAKARNKIAGTTRTATAKARVKSAGTTNTVSAKARAKSLGITKTVTAKARVKVLGVTVKSISAKARVKIAKTTRTVDAKARARILAITRTVTARARVINTAATKTVSAKARVKALGFTRTISAKAKASFLANRSITAKSRVKLSGITRTVTAKATVVFLYLRNVSAKARVKGTGSTNTITAKARVKTAGITRTVTAKAFISFVGVARLISARARVKVAGQTTRSITAKARVLKAAATRTITAKARVRLTITKTVTAKARARLLAITRTVSAKARVKGLGTTRTVSAKARILKLAVRTMTAKARIKIADILRTVSAKAFVNKSGVEHTVSARARVAKTYGRTVSAKASVKRRRPGRKVMNSLISYMDVSGRRQLQNERRQL